DRAEPRLDQPDVIGDRLAVPGQEDLGRQLAGPLQRVDVVDQRAGAAVGAVERAADQRVRGDVGDQVVADDQQPALGVPEERVGGAVARPVLDFELAVAEPDRFAVGQLPGYVNGRAPAAKAAGDDLQRLG